MASSNFPRADLWDRYAELRAESLRPGGDGKEATEFYKAHRAEMDEGAQVAWPERHNPDELSGIQHGMNLKLRDEATFWAEYQNLPLAATDDTAAMLDADAVASKVNGRGRVLTLGLDGKAIWAGLPVDVRTEREERIASSFEPDYANALLAGVRCSDIVVRDLQVIPPTCDRAAIEVDGVLASGLDVDTVFCQLVPWPFDYEKLCNTKLAFRFSRFGVNRLLANLDVGFDTALLGNFARPLLQLAEEPDEELRHSLCIESDGKLSLLPRQWKGIPLAPDNEAPARWQNAGFDDSVWRDTSVPGLWSRSSMTWWSPTARSSIG